MSREYPFASAYLSGRVCYFEDGSIVVSDISNDSLIGKFELSGMTCPKGLLTAVDSAEFIDFETVRVNYFPGDSLTKTRSALLNLKDGTVEYSSEDTAIQLDLKKEFNSREDNEEYERISYFAKKSRLIYIAKAFIDGEASVIADSIFTNYSTADKNAIINACSDLFSSISISDLSLEESGDEYLSYGIKGAKNIVLTFSVSGSTSDAMKNGEHRIAIGIDSFVGFEDYSYNVVRIVDVDDNAAHACELIRELAALIIKLAFNFNIG